MIVFLYFRDTHRVDYEASWVLPVSLVLLNRSLEVYTILPLAR